MVVASRQRLVALSRTLFSHCRFPTMTKPEETATKENGKHQGSNELAKEENSPVVRNVVVKDGKTCLVAPPENQNACKDGNGNANGTDEDVDIARRTNSNCKVKRADSKTKQKTTPDASKPKKKDQDAPAKTSKKCSNEHGKSKSKPRSKDNVKNRKGSKQTVKSKKKRNSSATITGTTPVVFNIKNLTIMGQTEKTKESGVRDMQELPGKSNSPATSGLQPGESNIKLEQGGKDGSKFPGQ